MTEISKDAKERLEKNIARSLGINMTAIFDDKTVFDAASLMAMEARSKIVTIPEEYLFDVSQAVLANYQGLPQPEGRSLTEQIRFLGGVTEIRGARPSTCSPRTSSKTCGNCDACLRRRRGKKGGRKRAGQPRL